MVTGTKVPFNDLSMASYLYWLAAGVESFCLHIFQQF